MKANKLSPMAAEFDGWIQKIKDKNGWTDKDIADRAGLAHSTISRGRKPDYAFAQSWRTLRSIEEAADEPIPLALRGMHEAPSVRSQRHHVSNRHHGSETATTKTAGPKSILPETRHCAGLAVSGNGEVTVPAALCAQLGLAAGDKLVGRIRDGRLILEPFETAVQRAQDLVRRYIPDARGEVDKFIAERRAEAARE